MLDLLIGKGRKQRLPSQQRGQIADGECGLRLADPGGKPACSLRRAGIASQRLLQCIEAGRDQRRLIGLDTAVEHLADLLHALGYGDVAHATIAETEFQIGEAGIDELLRQLRSRRRQLAQAPQNQQDVDGQRFEATLETVRNPALDVERRPARGLGDPPEQRVYRGAPVGALAEQPENHTFACTRRGCGRPRLAKAILGRYANPYPFDKRLGSSWPCSPWIVPA